MTEDKKNNSLIRLEDRGMQSGTKSLVKRGLKALETIGRLENDVAIENESDEPRLVQADPSLKARKVHYLFAHYSLRHRLRSVPQMFVKNLSEAKSELRLGFYWASDAGVNREPGEDSISTEGMKSIPFEFADDHYGVLIQMPQPERGGEAYYVAIILKDGKDPEFKYRYLTLEVGFDGTMIGEWLPSGTHILHGTGPSPSREKFLEAVREIVDGVPGQLDGH